MKKIVGFFVIVLALLAVLLLARNIVIKAVLETGAKILTGMSLSIQKFDLDILNTSVDMEGLVLKNPAGFHDTELLNIPKILIAYQRAAIFTGKLHFNTLEFQMEQFTVVKNEKGELNLDRLKALQGTQKPSAQAPEKKPKEMAKPIPIQIDIMRLKIGKVAYVDYSGGQPSTKEFRINLDQTFQNITDVYSVARLIVLKAMMSSGLANIVNFDAQGLAGTLMNSSTQMASQLAGSTASAVEDQAKALTKSVTSAASDLKKKIKLPF